MKESTAGDNTDLLFYVRGFLQEDGSISVYLIERERTYICSATPMHWSRLVYTYPPPDLSEEEAEGWVDSYHDGYLSRVDFNSEATILVHTHKVQDEDKIKEERLDAWEDAVESAQSNWDWHEDWRG